MPWSDSPAQEFGPGATLEIKVQYMAAVMAGAVRCRASFLRQDRSVSFLQSHATRADGALSAQAAATRRLLPAKAKDEG